MAGMQEVVDYLRAKGHVQAAKDVVKAFSQPPKKWASAPTSKALGVETRLVQGHAPQPDPYGAANMPVYVTATFQQASATEFGDFDLHGLVILHEQLYRAPPPTRGCNHCLAFSTGMAALAAVVRLCSSGDEVLPASSCGGTYRLLAKGAKEAGVTVKYVAMDGPDGPRWKGLHGPRQARHGRESDEPDAARLRLEGLSAVCTSMALPRSGQHAHVATVAETFSLGADIVVHSATKFICGHSDTMAGVCCVDDEALFKRLYFVQTAEGTGLAPVDCFLALRGLKTMALRVDRAQQNAIAIASYLRQHKLVTKVYYATSDDHPDRELHLSQATGGGCVVCFTTGDIELSKHVVSATKLFSITVSFGSVHSLISSVATCRRLDSGRGARVAGLPGRHQGVRRRRGPARLGRGLRAAFASYRVSH